MVFDNHEDMFEFYKEYARKAGFPVQRRSRRMTDDGILRGVTFGFAKGREHQSRTQNQTKPRGTSKSGCNTYITGRMEISMIELAFHCEKLQLVMLGYGGYEYTGCTLKDIRNATNEVRNARLGHGDAMLIMKYFAKITAENSGFYFKIQSEVEGYLEIVFWADGMSRAAYKEFGEVISFDTTAWLECMSEIAPKVIVTDQAKAVQNAIEIVFPQARHSWCLWHVMKKLPEKFGSYNMFHEITFDMRDAVYDSQSLEEFKQLWDWMVSEYDLYENKWLNDLYKERVVECLIT
ncbi:protein FAR-RED IMPAIRED RESPONSE 1-like [Papaver somniferum]|uniref:protein FAR-RED IMPAIRED RESPONSE 1-like n=1 Tax=Papaver somniferum TaxID=3469 RepID=UPI000E6FD493|nr:protein FAR-RED IMPAIRED RESPONSE 1-like [Papaver somniferum]